MTSDDIVEAMAWGICKERCPGAHPCDMEGSHCKPDKCKDWRLYTDDARAAIRAVTEAGGLVLREVPGRMPWPNYQEYMQRTAGWNAALAAVRAAAVEVGP